MPRRTATSTSCSRWRTAASCASATCASSGGSAAGRSIRRPARCSTRRRAAGSSPATGPEPLDDAFTVRAFRARLRGRRGRLKPLLLDQAFIAGVGNIYADEALWRARLHPLRTAATLRPPDEARLYRELRAVLAEAVARRGSLDRRLHRARRRRERCRSAWRSTSGPASRAPAAAGRSGGSSSAGGRRTSARGASGCPPATAPGPRAILAAARAPARPGPPLGGAAGGGDAGPDAGRGRAGRGRGRRAAARARTERTRRAAATRRARRAARRARRGRRRRRALPAPRARTGLTMSLVRLSNVTREIGTFVILDAVNAAVAVGERVGLVGPNGAGKTTLLRIVAGQRRARPRRGPAPARR